MSNDHTSTPSFTIKPIPKSTSSKCNFGVILTGLDLNNISGKQVLDYGNDYRLTQDLDEDVKSLSDTIWTHKVVLVKGQKDLLPIKQWELVTRFDPDAPQVHSHGDMKTFRARGGVLSRSRDVVGIPGAENVRLIGKGFQGEDHYGIKNMTVHKALSHDFHALDLSDEEFNKGHTRFQRWHIDAPLYERDPAWFTTLRCIRRPHGPDCPPVTVHWDDGTGQTMQTSPGLTAFFSNVQAYELMTPEERAVVDHSWVEYAPHPYQWISDCKGNSNGLGLVSQNKEKSIQDLGEWESKHVKRYPMCWVNPITQERAFMVHGICARKLFLRSSSDDDPKIIDDVTEIRKFLKPLQERVLKPEYILIPEMDEGDVVIWANYQLFHTAIDYPGSYGPRTMHQANIAASKGPIGPVPIPSIV